MGCRRQWSSSQTFWGLLSQVLVLKVGVPDVGCGPSLLREALGFEFPPDCGSLCLGGDYGTLEAPPPTAVCFPSSLPNGKGSISQLLVFQRKLLHIELWLERACGRR